MGYQQVIFCALLVITVTTAQVSDRSRSTTDDYEENSENPVEGAFDLTQDGIVAACSKTDVNADVKEVNFAWSISGLAKYIRAVGGRQFMNSDRQFNISGVNLKASGLPGKWDFRLHASRMHYHSRTYYMDVFIYYNTTNHESVTIQPKLILRAGDRTATTIYTVETSKTYHQTYGNPNEYDSSLKSTTYTSIYTRNQYYYRWDYRHVFSFNPENLDALVGYHKPASKSSGSTPDDDLDLIFKISIAKLSSDDVSSSSVSNSCSLPTFDAALEAKNERMMQSSTTSRYSRYYY